VDSLHRGEIGCLRGGTYRIPGGMLVIRRSGFTLRSYPGERATIRGNTQVLPGANDVTLSKLNFVGDGTTASTVKTYGSGTTFSDSDITNYRLGGSCVQVGSRFGTAERLRILHNRIHDCGLGGRSYPSEHGIYAGYVSGGEISGNLIYNLNQGYAIQFYPSAQGVTFEHNVVDGGPTTLRGGVTFAGGASQPSSRNTVEYNIIAYAAAYGIGSIWGAARGTGNIARDNCLFRNKPNVNTANGGFTSTHNVTANPLFVNRVRHDYRLRARSRCLRIVGYDAAARLRRR
jgi:hypothetical protein